MKFRTARRALVLGLGITALSLSSGASPASADSVGCTWAEGGGASYVCLGIYGSGRYVNQFRVSRNHQYTSICGYKARVHVQQPNSSTVYHYSGFYSGCSWNTAWMDLWPRRYYVNNSKACGTWYESGRYISGVPCNKIYN